MSFYLTDAEWAAIQLSLQVASLAIVIALPPAVLLGYALARWKFPGHTLVNALVHLPIVLPPVVTGYVLLALFGRQGMLGSFFADVFGIVFAFRWTGAALAAGIMAFPLIIRPVKLSFELSDGQLEEAAHSLGTSRLKTFLLITLPLALPGILSGAVLGFAKAMGEFGATITFVSNIPGETRTLSLALYTEMQSLSGDAGAIRLTVIAIAVSICALVFSEVISRRLSRRLGGQHD